MLIGDVNDFLEYTKGYYGISTELTSEDLRKISAENANTYGIIKREQQQEEENIKPLIITITNPESIVLDFLLPEILNGETMITVLFFCYLPEVLIIIKLFSNLLTEW